MSVHPHRRNFSQIISKSQNTSKIRPTNRSLNKIQPHNNYSWLLMAAKQYYHKTNNLKAAIVNFQQYLQHNPNHQQSLYLCAVCYMHVDEYQKAIQKLKEYLNTKKSSQNMNRKLVISLQNQLPNNSHAYLLLSMAYNKINNIEKSFQAVNQALKQDTKFQQAYCFRAKLYLKIGENERSFYDYKQALKSNNRCWAAWVGIGDYYTQVNNYRQAYSHYEKAKNCLQEDINENLLNGEKQKQDEENRRGQKQQQGKQYMYSSQKRADECNLREKITFKKQRTFTQSYSLQKQQDLYNNDQDRQKLKQKQSSKFKIKLETKSITSPYVSSSNKTRNFLEKQRQSHKFNLINLQNAKNSPLQVNINDQTPLSKSNHIKDAINQNQFSQSMEQIELKISICLYFLGDHKKSMEMLQNLLANKNNKINSEIFYYLAVNQLKLYQESKYATNKLSTCNNNKISEWKPKQKDHKDFIKNKNSDLKITLLPTSSTTNNNTSLPFGSLHQPYQHYSYIQQAILNLELSIKANSNKKIMTKSCKTLIKLYIENNQFYETESVVKLAQKFGIDIKYYKELSEACMLVIKQKYCEAVGILKRLYDSLNEKQDKNEKSKEKNKERKKSQYSWKRNSKKNMKFQSQSQPKSKEVSRRSHQLDQKVKDKRQSIRIEENFDFSPQNTSSNKRNKTIQVESHEFSANQSKLIFSNRKQHYRNSENLNKMVDFSQKDEQNLEHSNQFKNITMKNKLNMSSNRTNSKQPYNNTATINHTTSSNELQWMNPIILLFRAYSQYFSDNFIQCLEQYEHYQNYIKDYLGKEPESDIYLSYNKILCEGILMLDNEMVEESLEKFMQCINGYYRLLRGVPVQPILFRILGLLRIAISETPFLSQQINSKVKIYISIIEVLDHYMPAIKNNPLVHYYYGLVLYELEKYKEASDSLQKCLKLADECSWRFLFVKGAIQIKNKAYKEAVRQFSAGLIVEQRAQMYLGRCICYIELFDQSEGEQQAYMQKSFEDLQKFIQLQEDKDKISKWVTKILFFNKAYEEVTKSIKKISNEALESSEDLIRIMKCLNVYNGTFQDGGVLGQVMINAFEGKFQQNSVQINGERHEIILSDFFDEKYKKWLIILNLYSAERYSELIKYLQICIFEQKNEEEATQLRYNLAIIYYLAGQCSKADNVIAGLPKYLQDIALRVEKFISREFSQDECIDDLQLEFKGVKRLSTFLPYRKIRLDQKNIVYDASKSVYVKISLPFPRFYKPNIDIELDDTFLFGQTAQTCIPKKIEAPWIKKVTGNIQFTQNIIDSENASILEVQQDDVLASNTTSKQSISLSSLQKF